MANIESEGWAIWVGGNTALAGPTKQDALDMIELYGYGNYGPNQTYIFPVTVVNFDDTQE